MKVSASTPPDTTAPSRSAGAAAVVAGVWLALHLPWLAPTLEDIDSMNFALGLRDFDPALHQPHPPGYPVYIALGRLSLALINVFGPGWPRIEIEALALALWSAVGGAIAILAAADLFRSLAALAREHPATPPSRPRAIEDPALWGAALMGCAPLFWLSGLRPMTDVPGLAATLVSVALIARGFTDRRWLPWGALVAGLAVGMRSQTVWLTFPALLLGLIQQRRAGIVWLISRPIVALAAGGIAWAVPLVVASGGLDAYLRALGTQASLDFAGVDMVWLNPTPRRIARSLYETFVWPWVSLRLARAVAVAAALGLLVQAWRERRALVALVVMFAPYTLFHFLLQETFTSRYALPIVPAVAWLAARGLATTGRAMPALAGGLVAATLYVAVPGGLAFGRDPHPVFRAIEEAAARAPFDHPAGIYSHYSLWRPLQVADLRGVPAIPPRHHFEWLGLVDYWRGGGRAPVWFLADPRRTDLALIDPAAREDVTRYEWAPAARPELSGSRPTGADWYRIEPPGWFLGEGWSLTPETGGEARANAKGPDQQPIQGWVRRRSEPMHLLIGTRHLGEVGEPEVEFELALDGEVRDRWRVAPAANALRFLILPSGVPGEGDYALVTVSARAADGSARRVPAAVRQFDVQPVSRPIAGFADGWHELEYDAGTGRLWRWSSDEAVIRVSSATRGIRLTLTGESPLRYFDAAPTVTLTAGTRVVDTFRPGTDFVRTIVITEEALTAAGGVITLRQDRAYLPGRAEGTADPRRLGLRLFNVRVSADTHDSDGM